MYGFKGVVYNCLWKQTKHSSFVGLLHGGRGRGKRSDPPDSHIYYFQFSPHFVVVPTSLFYFYCKILYNVAIFFSIPPGFHLGIPLTTLASPASPCPYSPGLLPLTPSLRPLHLHSNLVDCDWGINKSKFHLRVTFAGRISFLTTLHIISEQFPL